MSLKPEDIAAERVCLLSLGKVESKNLAESLALDHATLFRAVFPDATKQELATLDDAYTKRLRAAARACHDRLGDRAIPTLGKHPSDTVRGWAALTLAERPKLGLKARLECICALADDAHFGVREHAWMAVRPAIVAEPMRAIELLMPWTADASANVRRFATEATRPRGVWCTHIKELKANPTPAEPLLDALHADPSKYVHDSVSNWVNDAAKTRPDWTRAITKRWTAQAKDKDATTKKIIARVVRRSLRSIDGENARGGKLA